MPAIVNQDAWIDGHRVTDWRGQTRQAPTTGQGAYQPNAQQFEMLPAKRLVHSPCAAFRLSVKMPR